MGFIMIYENIHKIRNVFGGLTNWPCSIVTRGNWDDAGGVDESMRWLDCE